MRISEADRRALVLLTGFFLLMGLYLLVVEPFLSRLDTIARQHEEATAAIAKGERERRLLDVRRQRLGEARHDLDAAIDLHGLVVPEGRRTGETVAGLRRAADALGVALLHVRPTALPGDPFAGVALEVECQGSWEALLRLVHHGATAPELTVIETLDLARPEGGQIRARLRLVRWFLSASSGDTATAAIPAVRRFQVAASASMAAAPVLVAELQGRLRGDAVTWELLTGSEAEVLDHLRSGDAEAAVVHATGLLSVQADGVPVVAVAVLAREVAPPVLVVRPDPALAAVGDLAGRAVAAVRGGPEHFWLDRLCRDQGVDPQRLRLMPLAMAAGADALARRGVDGALLRAPWLAQAVRDQGCQILAEPRAEGIHSWQVLVTTRRMIEEQPEAVRRLVATVLGGGEALEGPEADQRLATSLWQSRSQVAALRREVAWATLAENRRLLGDGAATLAADLVPFADFLRGPGGLTLPAGALTAATDQFLPAKEGSRP